MLYENKLEYQDLQIKLLKNIVIQQDQKIQMLKNRHAAAYSQEVRVNLTIQGILEKSEESCEQLEKEVKSFFKDVMKIEEEFPFYEAYHVGKQTPKNVMVKLKYPSDKAIVFGNVSKLKGKKNAQKSAYCISEDKTDEKEELSEQYRMLVKKSEKQEDDDKKFKSIKMAKGKIYVNNSIVCKYVKPPSNAEILQLTKNQLEEVQRAKIIKDGEYSERESDFVSFAFKARNGLQESKRLNMVMQHIACAYRLDNPFEPYRTFEPSMMGIMELVVKFCKY